jgi:hypothetical protein
MRCSFCATGKGGFARNLAPHEIVDQAMTVQEAFGRRVSNVGELPWAPTGLAAQLHQRTAVRSMQHLDVNSGPIHDTVTAHPVPGLNCDCVSTKYKSSQIPGRSVHGHGGAAAQSGGRAAGNPAPEFRHGHRRPPHHRFHCGRTKCNRCAP